MVNEKRESSRLSLVFVLYSEDSALLIKQRRLIVFDLLEDSPHEGLANETATVLDLVPLAESVQRALLTVVEQDTYPIFSRGFFH